MLQWNVALSILLIRKGEVLEFQKKKKKPDINISFRTCCRLLCCKELSLSLSSRKAQCVRKRKGDRPVMISFQRVPVLRDCTVSLNGFCINWGVFHVCLLICVCAQILEPGPKYKLFK